eukprot:TRINITY_DN1765_c0_g1_i2.p2 TRINITY_DN1765_c0_g1~~TRINITY_DN1765_c0_g1_i2.p2  ORF type:complete len:103 (+),score=1.25 TRINITY_DN1765_c0_g1_i2:735-1043(+)
MSLLMVGSLCKIHIYVLFVSIWISRWRSVEGHSGYRLPWHIDNIWWYANLFALTIDSYRLSWNGGSNWHDLHHTGFNYNFGEKWIDLIFGTDYQSYKKSNSK